jgi:hypothetical protein
MAGFRQKMPVLADRRIVIARNKLTPPSRLVYGVHLQHVRAVVSFRITLLLISTPAGKAECRAICALEHGLIRERTNTTAQRKSPARYLRAAGPQKQSLTTKLPAG